MIGGYGVLRTSWLLLQRTWKWLLAGALSFVVVALLPSEHESVAFGGFWRAMLPRASSGAMWGRALVIGVLMAVVLMVAVPFFAHLGMWLRAVGRHDR